jgi:endonuclease III
VSAALKLLKEAGLFTVDAMAAAKPNFVKKLISNMPYLNKKADYLVASARQLKANFNGQVPSNMQDLCTLKGVGPKIAAVTLEEAHGLTHDIPIASNMLCIFRSFLKWADPEDVTPGAVAARIKSWLPKSFWGKHNPLYSGLGQLLSRSEESLIKTQEAARKIGKESHEAVSRVSLLFPKNLPKTEVPSKERERFEALNLSEQFQCIEKGLTKVPFGSLCTTTESGKAVRRPARIMTL